MNNTPSMGIIGAGFVGGAMIRGFSGYANIKVYDKFKDIGSLYEVCQQDVIFVCVPTPMRKSGECDTRIVKSCLDEVERELNNQEYGDVKTVVIRSTVPPNFIEDVIDYECIDVMYMPEFLTERTADLDFINATRFILGHDGTIPSLRRTELVRRLFNNRFPNTRFVVTSFEAAGLIKYGTNNFFTVKLSYFNELAKIAEAYGEDGQEIINEILEDGRIGRSHFQVPGPDGDYGWGGHCFPKDNRAFSHIAGFVSEPARMVDAAWEVNEEVRKNRNWEQQKGRAVSDD